MEGVFLDLSLVLALAVVLGTIFRAFNQPKIIAYMLAGVLIGPLGIFDLHDPEAMASFSEIGITLLLFVLGLEFKLSELRSVGKVSLITGVGQIFFTSAIGFGLGLLLGISPLAAIYLSIALAFSSTTVIVKLLNNKKALHSLYGRVAIGFLLVQDLVAIVVLIVLAGFAASEGTALPPASTFFWLLLKAGAIFTAAIWLSKKALPYLVHRISISQELLFLFPVAWAFGIAALVSTPQVGLTIEVGGFLAGLMLANSKESFHIISKLRPLRDFFVILFFVVLGSNLIFDNLLTILIPAVLLSAFVVIGNPIIVMTLMGRLGFHKKTAFMSGLTVAQISEFSLIVAFIGLRIGHISPEIVSLVALMAMITFTLSTYAITNSERLYAKLAPWLGIFEQRQLRDETEPPSKLLKNHIVIAGVKRIGHHILENLHKQKQQIVAVDLDPNVVDTLHKEKFKALFGDLTDTDIREKAQLNNARYLISTLPDVTDNLILINSVKEHAVKTIIITLHEDTSIARSLRQAGADHVLVADNLLGELVGEIVHNDDGGKEG